MVPIVGMEPDPAGLQLPFMMQGREQKPQAQPSALGCGDESKVLQLDVRQGAFELTEPDGFTLAISKNVDPAAFGFEKPHQLMTRHLETLVPAERPADAFIQVHVLIRGWFLERNALRADTQRSRCGSPGQLEIPYTEKRLFHGAQA